MTQLDLVPLWAAILGFAVLMYILLDGFDLGVGILFLFRKSESDRDVMMASVSPVWDFNETWLVLGGAGLMAVFPGAFAIIIPAVYFPVLLMLLGLIFRGVAFEFRGVPDANRRLWNIAFACGSVLATFAQGVILGMFVQGFNEAGGKFVGTSWDWVRPFPIFTGFGLIAGYALQGATWLIMKTQGGLQMWSRRVAQRVMVLVFIFIGIVSIVTPMFSPRIAARWFTWPNLAFFAPVPLVTLLLAGLLVRGADREREVLPFVCSVGLFFLSFSGLVISLWPMIAPPSVTLWEAAAAPVSHEFLMIGTAFVLPILLIYVVWSYWVFRGKASGHEGYGHE
ncbi:cytochrome d ubiquinol oxidase subunit II [Trinickia dinghuensis]|uniref:Cytochrome d ubiquinol oxidase subunit II n=1 Tax=Trinickia dinghuensis TaxID=2291023 RepID=A0A3D8JY70_9BURK|nr:cytochrome d ubiquinol oxidase subunit II [Trinickia dinghuensis]RDU97574.1 cytochrome d ubiquinol oxidase subunit II [Trinickia dinghuensis]